MTACDQWVEYMTPCRNRATYFYSWVGNKPCYYAVCKECHSGFTTAWPTYPRKITQHTPLESPNIPQKTKFLFALFRSRDYLS